MEGSALATVPQQPITIQLEDGDLWTAFEHTTNEMVVSKNGRRLFPSIKVRIQGLEPGAFYTIFIEFKQIGANRWKFLNGSWLSGAKVS